VSERERATPGHVKESGRGTVGTGLSGGGRGGGV